MSAEKLSDNLRDLGMKLRRCQRATAPQDRQKNYRFFYKLRGVKRRRTSRYFSVFTKKEKNNVVPTWLTYTSDETIEVVKGNDEILSIVSGVVNTHRPRALSINRQKKF